VARYEGPLVDTDVHHTWHPSEIADYFPTKWRDYVAERPSRVSPPSNSLLIVANGARHLESYEPGFTRETVYEILCREMLDKHPYYRILMTFDLGQYGSQLNPEFAIACARAANDWNRERWLERDERCRSVVVITPGHPEEAAKEIRRVGGHERLAAVMLSGNVLGRPYGDPIYDPIYKAAVEMGLQVVMHIGTGDSPSWGVTAVGGHFGTGALYASGIPQQGMAYVASFIANGTFERFPELKVMALEYGVGWLPWLVTRLDNDYELLKRESSWVKKWPSEYFRDHIKVATQPLEESAKKSQLIDLMELVEGVEDLLCFSTDYPHFTGDDPEYIARLLPRSWQRKVFCDNACDFFGWERPPEAWQPPRAARPAEPVIRR
jgi:predicted TIM-barrel fold metal-dependent hydrolase